jgi:hypothetical protein
MTQSQTTYSVTLQKVADRTRKLTRTNSVTLTDAAMIDLSNETNLVIERELAQESVEEFGVVAYTDVSLATNYDKPTNLLKYLRLEINYTDADDNTQWRKINIVDLPNLPRVWQDFVNSNPEVQPAMDDFGGQFYAAPLAETAVPQGLRIWYIAKIDDYTSLANSLQYPLNLFWDVIAYGNAMRYWQPINKDESAYYQTQFMMEIKKMAVHLQNENYEQIWTEIADFTNNGLN